MAEQDEYGGHKPELLVRVDWELPPTRGISSMYFEDYGEMEDSRYIKALHELHPTAIIRGVTRKVKPTEEDRVADNTEGA